MSWRLSFVFFFAQICALLLDENVAFSVDAGLLEPSVLNNTVGITFWKLPDWTTQCGLPSGTFRAEQHCVAYLLEPSVLNNTVWLTFWNLPYWTARCAVKYNNIIFHSHWKSHLKFEQYQYQSSVSTYMYQLAKSTNEVSFLLCINNPRVLYCFGGLRRYLYLCAL